VQQRQLQIRQRRVFRIYQMTVALQRSAAPACQKRRRRAVRVPVAVADARTKKQDYVILQRAVTIWSLTQFVQILGKQPDVMSAFVFARTNFRKLYSRKSQRRAAALLEVLGIYLAGPVMMIGLRRVLGVSLTNPLNHLTAHATGAELVIASRQLFALLLFQNSGYFLLAAPLNWWYRRRRPSDYGLTKAGHTWKVLILAGLAAAAFWEWPVVSVALANSFHPSPTVPWRQALMDMSMWRWQYWLFTGVLSWAGALFFEELFFRGYCQRRLAEDWGDGPAILGAACLFTFGHSQYFRTDPYNASMLAGLLLSAIGFGLVFAWTRSLIPSMIAHAVFDIPLSTAWQSVLLAGLVIGALMVWRRALPIIKQAFSTGNVATLAALGIAGACYAALTSLDQVIVYLVGAAYAMLGLAVVLEIKDRLQDRAVSSVAARA
jgi:membrane protease YdiL (CAAX protease family)